MSGYLLDTHVIIWCFTNDPTLSFEARETIVDEENEGFFKKVKYGGGDNLIPFTDLAATNAFFL